MTHRPCSSHTQSHKTWTGTRTRTRTLANSITTHLFLSFALLFLPTATAYSNCPNQCSGHGTCSLPTSTGSTGAGTLSTTLGLCTCDTGYEGPACSWRPCPKGISWFDAATANNVAHRTNAICSGIGICESNNGQCSCPNGYTGDACQRQDCEADSDVQCSGHGRCRSMFYVAENHGPPATTSAKLKAGPVYANWDAHKLRDCLCDWGYTGSFCQYQMCPKGDDPRTTGQADLIFTIQTSGTSGTALAGYFTFHFYGHSTQIVANAHSPTLSNANCAAFIQALPNVASATCAVSSISSDHKGATLTITITQYATIPYENNFFWHDGVPSTDFMGCSMDDLTGGASPDCAIAITQASTKEYAYCSNRGLCDLDTGSCTCFANFYGVTCENEGTTNVVFDSSSALTLAAESATYTGTLLSMAVGTAATTNFKFIDMKASGTSKFVVDGVGVLTMGGITVDTTGITATDGGASITKATNNDVMTITASQDSFSNDILVLSAAETAAQSFNAIHFIAGNGGSTVFTVKGDGAIVTTANEATTSTSTGSIKTAGGISAAGAIYAGGKIVTLDATDSSSELTGSIITRGGMGIAKRLTSTQLEVKSSAMLSSSTASAYFRNSHATFAGNVLLVESSMTSGASSYNLIQANINMEGTKALKFEVDGTGYMTAAGGANIVAGGLNVAAGGATVAAGGLTVSSGTITLTSTAAQAITHTGSSNNGLTISSGGGVTLAGAVIFGASGCNCASSGGLDLKNAIPMRFDGSTEDNNWLNIAVGAGPSGSSKTLTLPVGETGTLLTDASTGASLLTSVGTLTGLTVAGTTVGSSTTGVTKVSNTKTSDFVGNLLQLDTAMATATNAYNIILSRSNTGSINPTTQFKVDGTGKVTAAGGALFGGSGMALASGDLTLTSSGAQAITHTGSGNNGLTISSGGGVTVSGAVTFGSTSAGVTFKNNHPIQFDGETEDANYLILNVGNGPTGSSKTLTLPVDSDATIVTSASTLAVTIQSSNSVRVESSKFVNNVITHGDDNSFLSIEGVKFEDQAVSLVSTFGMTSHLTNSGGDILLTGSADQDITKSGGGDLIISASDGSNTVYTHVENWKFNGGAVTASGDLSIDAGSVRLEKMKCTENVCINIDNNAALAIETVQFNDGAISQATTMSMSGTLTNSGGDFLFTGSADQDITKSGGGDLIISASDGSNTVYTHVESWKFNGGAVTSTADLTVNGNSVTIEKLKCVENVCSHADNNNYITIELVQFLNGVMSEVKDLTMSGDLTNTGGDLLFTKTANQLITKSGSGNLVITGSASVCVEDWCFNGGDVSASSSHITLDGSSVTLEKFKCTDNVCEHQDAANNVMISIEVVQFYNGAMSAITTLAMTGDLSNTAGNLLFTSSGGDQAITKSGSGNLIISGPAAVCVESWCFTAAAAASDGHMTIDGASVSIEKFKCDGVACTHADDGTNDYLTIEDVKFLNGAITEVTTLAMAGSLTNSAGDVLLTKSSDQTITKSGGGDLIISNSVNSDGVSVESWKFIGGDVTSSAHLTIDAASVRIEKLKCVENVCSHSDDANNQFISIEVVQFFNGAIAAATSLAMSGDLTNSGGNLLFTKAGDQLITKSNSGDLIISNSVSNEAVQVESFVFTEGAITGVGLTTDLSIDAGSTRIENMKCTASSCEHVSGAGNALIIEDVSYVDGAISGKSLTLDPNNAAGGAITVTNTATQSSGSLVSITGTTGQTALSIPTGNVNLGNGKFVVNAAGVETFGVNHCTASLTMSTTGDDCTCNSVVGTLTLTLANNIAVGECGVKVQMDNNKINTVNAVVIFTMTEYAGMGAAGSFTAGVPYLLQTTTYSGAVDFHICNVGSTVMPANAVVKAKFIVAGS